MSDDVLDPAANDPLVNSLDDLALQLSRLEIPHAFGPAAPNTGENDERVSPTLLFVPRRHRMAARSLLLASGQKPLIAEPTLSPKDRERFLIFDAQDSLIREIHLVSRFEVLVSRRETLSIPAEILIEMAVLLDRDADRLLSTVTSACETISWALGEASNVGPASWERDAHVFGIPSFSKDLFDECVDRRRESKNARSPIDLRARVRRELRARQKHSATPHIELERVSGFDPTEKWFEWDGMESCGLAAGGISVSILGGDGAGKSTAVKAVTAWLGTGIPVRAFHFGKPPGRLTSRVVYRLRGMLRRLGFSVPSPMTFDRANPEQITNFQRFGLMLHFTCLCRDRMRAYHELRSWIHRGGVGVCDRYPDSRFVGMDGPRLQDLFPSANGMIDRLVRWESRQYAKIRPTDLEIILRVSPETAARRQPQDDPVALRRRCLSVLDVIENLDGPEVIVDADREMSTVHHDLFRRIWSAL
jgi:thymidylate kinase